MRLAMLALKVLIEHPSRSHCGDDYKNRGDWIALEREQTYNPAKNIDKLNY